MPKLREGDMSCEEPCLGWLRVESVSALLVFLASGHAKDVCRLRTIYDHWFAFEYGTICHMHLSMV